MTVVISVDGFRSYLKDCDITVELKQGINYAPPKPPTMRPDASGDITFDEWTLTGKNCFIIASIMPGPDAIRQWASLQLNPIATPFIERGGIPDDASGTIWFKLSPRIGQFIAHVSAKTSDSTNRGSTSTTDKGSGSLSYGIGTVGGERSVTENSPSVTDGSERSRTDDYTVKYLEGAKLDFSPTPPIISAQADADKVTGFA